MSSKKNCNWIIRMFLSTEIKRNLEEMRLAEVQGLREDCQWIKGSLDPRLSRKTLVSNKNVKVQL